jgi:hypothetical protein
MSPAPPSLPPSPDASATSPASTQSTSTSSNPKLPEHDASRPRTPQEAERFFRRIALENQPPSRTMRWLSIGGWVAGACKFLFLRPVGRLIPRLVAPCAGRRTRCGLIATPRLSRCIYLNLYHAMIRMLIIRVPCFPMHLLLRQSPLDTWFSTQISGTANTSFHP